MERRKQPKYFLQYIYIRMLTMFSSPLDLCFFFLSRKLPMWLRSIDTNLFRHPSQTVAAAGMYIRTARQFETSEPVWAPYIAMVEEIANEVGVGTLLYIQKNKTRIKQYTSPQNR